MTDRWIVTDLTHDERGRPAPQLNGVPAWPYAVGWYGASQALVCVGNDDADLSAWTVLTDGSPELHAQAVALGAPDTWSSAGYDA